MASFGLSSSVLTSILPGDVSPVSLATERLISVHPVLAELLVEGGLRRGTTMAVKPDSGGVSLALGLVAAATSEGRWVALVGGPGASAAVGWGFGAAHELGVRLERTVVINPDGASWAAVMAACIDGFELVVTRPPERLAVADARRLTARLRERGSVLVTVGSCSIEPDVQLEVRSSQWSGIGRGHGYLQQRRVEVQAQGRRGATRPRRVMFDLPGGDGQLLAAIPPSASQVLTAVER
jgi:hypothetical protein